MYYFTPMPTSRKINSNHSNDWISFSFPDMVIGLTVGFQTRVGVSDGKIT